MNILIADKCRYDKNMPIFQYYFRKSQLSCNPIVKRFWIALYRYSANKRGIEIKQGTQIGGGLYLGHAYNITINPNVVIGSNVNIHKGVTIGKENRGSRIGSPTIGNYVWIGMNATVVGKIQIGDDVMIAPNSFVNFDVPSHSIVIGNPAKVVHRDNATEGYINRTVEI